MEFLSTLAQAAETNKLVITLEGYTGNVAIFKKFLDEIIRSPCFDGLVLLRFEVDRSYANALRDAIGTKKHNLQELWFFGITISLEDLWEILVECKKREIVFLSFEVEGFSPNRTANRVRWDSREPVLEALLP